jgi:two-component system LytT family response regulator
MTSRRINALVVEDEPLARQKAARLLARDSDISVVASVATVNEALQVDQLATIDLVLLDVRLPGRDGFHLLQELHQRDIDPFVIFVTASSEHAVAAFDAEAVDYVLKPFSADRFAKAIARAKDTIRRADILAEQLPSQGTGAQARETPSRRFPGRLLLSDHGRVLFLPTHSIEFIQAAGKNVKIFVPGHCYSIREALQEIEARLDASQFVRIHRSTIVNVEHIAELHALFHGDCEMVMKRGVRLTMSRRFRERMLPFLAGPWPT